MKSIRIKSYAKINLAIDVKGILPNGYHQVDMIMQQVDLHDEVLIRWIENNVEGIEIKVNTNRPYLPTDERNLAHKAAVAMAEKYGDKKKGTIRIDIKKNIPVAAGLGGGSGNGAAVIHGINELWKINLSLKELMEIGSPLGADIPFMLMGQARGNSCLKESIQKDYYATSCAFATHDGTELKPLKAFDSVLVLTKPPISVSTKEVYQGIDEVEIVERPDIDGMIRDLEKGNKYNIKEKMLNVLEIYTLKKYNCIVDTKNKAKQCRGIEKVVMSGSGPTLICIVDNEKNAKTVFEKMKKINRETFLTRTTL